MNTSTTIAGALEMNFHPDAAEFCETHNLQPLLELAGQLVARHFNLAGPVEVELETDPDSDEQRPILNVLARGSADSVQEQYQAYSTAWVTQVSPASILLIGLFVNIAEPSNDSP